MKKILLTALSIFALTISASFAADEASDIDSKEKSRRAAIEKIPSCANVLTACKNQGFVAGGYKDGNGLWRNCFHPVIKGKSANLKGQEVVVAANSTDVSACKSAAKEHLKGAKMAEKHHHEMKASDEAKAKKAARKAKAAEASAATVVAQ